MAKQKDVKQKVIAFRVTEPELKEIEEAFKATLPVGVESVALQGRKLMLDWAHGRIRYRVKKEEKLAPEMYPPMKASSRNGSRAA